MIKKKRQNGIGSIFKVKDYFYLRFRDTSENEPENRPLFNEKGERCTNRQEAEIAAQKIAKKRNTLKELDTREKYVQELAEIKNLKTKLVLLLIDAYDRSLERGGYRGSDVYINTRRNYWLDFCQYMQDNHSITHIGGVTADHARGYINYIRRNGRWKKELCYLRDGKELSYQLSSDVGNYLKNAIHKCLKRVFTLLSKELGYAREENPFHEIEFLPIDTEDREIFTETEIKMIFVKPTPLMKGMFTIGFCTGMREGDCATLRWSEIKCYNPNHVPGTKPDFQECEIDRISLKNGAKLVIPIEVELAEYLSTQWEVTGKEVYVIPEARYLYYQKDGKKRRKALSRLIIKYLQSLGIETTRKVPGRSRKQSVKDFHSLRHNFCYYAGLRGIPYGCPSSCKLNVAISM